MKSSTKVTQMFLFSLGISVAFLIAGFSFTPDVQPEKVFDKYSPANLELKDSVVNLLKSFSAERNQLYNELTRMNMNSNYKKADEVFLLQDKIQGERDRLKNVLQMWQQADASSWSYDSTQMIQNIDHHFQEMASIRKHISFLREDLALN